MAMTPAARAQAIYDQIQALNPNFDKLSSAEKTSLLTRLTKIWGDGDLVYIQENADVLPAASSATPGPGLQNPAGQEVVIPVTANTGSESTGATEAPEDLIGTGSIV